jgi:hypothetical protein
MFRLSDVKRNLLKALNLIDNNPLKIVREILKIVQLDKNGKYVDNPELDNIIYQYGIPCSLDEEDLQDTELIRCSSSHQRYLSIISLHKD